MTGKALAWFKSHLTGRCQRVKPGDCLYSTADLTFRVPRGSVLRPLLCTLYGTPLSSMISGHAIPNHPYADDSQVYVSFASVDPIAALNCLHSCLASVQSRVSTNKQKLKPDKTEFLLIRNENSGANTSLFFLLSFSVSKLSQQISARNLEVKFDKNSPSAHIYQQSAAHAFITSESAVYSLLPWSGWCKSTCICSCV